MSDEQIKKLEEMAQQQKDAIKRVNGMIEDINNQTEQHRQLRQLRNLTRQLRVEAPTSFVTLRNSQLPILAKEQTNSLLDGYKYVSELAEEDKRKFGAQIFDYVTNYLRLLAVKSLFPRGELKDMVVVRILDQKLDSVQLIPNNMSQLPQPFAQIKSFCQNLFVQCNAQQEDAMVFLFPRAIGGMDQSQQAPENVAKIVSGLGEIDLVNFTNHIFIEQGRVITNQELFEMLAKKQVTEEEIWIMLARFCNNLEAVQAIELLPNWLNEYVKYEAPKALPDLFINLLQINNPDEALGRLRIILGVYPSKICQVPQDIKMESLPVWFQSRILQIFYISGEHFYLDKAQQETKFDCQIYVANNAESLKQLVLKMQ